MSYPISQPADLANLDETLPLDTEDAGLIAAVDRQTRNLIKNVILKEHNSDGTHKQVNNLPANSISGAQLMNDGSDDTKRCVTTNSIHDGAVTAAKLAAACVAASNLQTSIISATHIVASTITTTQIASATIVGANIANATITATQLASGSVGTTQIQALAITNALIAALTVDLTAKSVDLGANKLLVGTGSGNVAASVGGDLTASYSGGVLSLTLKNSIARFPYAQLIDSNDAASVATTWNVRPASPGNWTVLTNAQAIVTVSARTNIVFAKAGTYWIKCWSVNQQTGINQLRLRDVTNSVTLLTGSPNVTPTGTQAPAMMDGVVVLAADGIQTQVQHYTQSTYAHGLGGTGSTGETDVMCMIEILKVS